MIEKFASFEEASFFVEQKRQEGYHAEILNEGTGFLWGPRTVGGFRVAVSDHPIAPSELEKGDESDHWLTRVLRVGFVAVLLVGAVVGIMSALLSITASLRIIFGLALTFCVVLLGGYMISRYRTKPPLE